MDLYEFQGKELFGRYGLPVSEGLLAASAADAHSAAAKLGGTVVLKAQVLSGGRGKAGGVRLAADPAAARREASRILGLVIGGERVERLWLEPACEIAREYYLSATLDRATRQTLMMFTTEGGVEIERVASEPPDALRRVHVHPLEGLGPHHARELLARLPDRAQASTLSLIVKSLYRCFIESDATLCEINPLVVTPEGEARALDAKVTIDDSALYRHPELARLDRPRLSETLEEFAVEKGVTYVKLDGSVGILGNGAGLSMSTVDVVVVAGGAPANFCDLGGGGSAAGVVASLEVIARDAQVRAVLFNIFGGITRCDEVARGILAAIDELHLTLPIVVRLEGTNAEDGRAILAQAGRPNLRIEATMLAAARRAVELAS